MFDIEITLYVIGGGMVAVLIILITGRLIGWALGISNITRKNEILIEQNNQILDALDQLIELQTPPDLPDQPGK